MLPVRLTVAQVLLHLVPGLYLASQDARHATDCLLLTSTAHRAPPHLQAITNLCAGLGSGNATAIAQAIAHSQATGNATVAAKALAQALAKGGNSTAVAQAVAQAAAQGNGSSVYAGALAAALTNGSGTAQAAAQALATAVAKDGCGAVSQALAGEHSWPDVCL